MSDLIPIHPQAIGQKMLPAVSARVLHETLGVKKDFSNWLHQYISKDDWRKDNDFSLFALEVDSIKGGRPAMDAALSIQMAEHIAMMTRTTNGRKVREYFRQARDERDAGLPASRGDLLVQMAEAYRLQEKRLFEIEATQQEQQRQFIEHQTVLLASQARIIEAMQLSQSAHEKSNLVIDNQQWLTLSEYVFLHALQSQMPKRFQNDYGKWLTAYCQERNIPVRHIGVANQRWTHENSYYTGAIDETLPGWLMRRQGQPDLQVVPVGEKPLQSS